MKKTTTIISQFNTDGLKFQDNAAAGNLRLRGHATRTERDEFIGMPNGEGYVVRIMRGAFRNAAQNDIRFVINHEGLALARTTADNLRVGEDDMGLAFEAHLTDVQASRDLHKLVEAGNVTQMSFRFYVDFEDITTEEYRGPVEEWHGYPYHKFNYVYKIEDISAVTYPAMGGTDVSVAQWIAEPGEGGFALSGKQSKNKTPVKTIILARDKNKNTEEVLKNKMSDDNITPEDAPSNPTPKGLEDGVLYSASEHQKVQQELAAKSAKIDELEKKVGEGALTKGESEDLTALMDSYAELKETNTKIASQYEKALINLESSRAMEKEKPYTYQELNAALFDLAQNGQKDVSPESEKILTGQYDQSTDVDSKGGYGIDDDFQMEVIKRLKHYGGLMNLADVKNTPTGADYHIQTNDDTSSVAVLVEEAATHETVGDINLGRISLKSYEYGADIVKVSKQLLRDTDIDFVSLIRENTAIRLGRGMSAAWCNGDGADKPSGILNNFPAGQLNSIAASADIDEDDIIDLQGSLDYLYDDMMNTSFVCNRSTWTALRKIEDDDNRKIWSKGLDMNAPNMLAGSPVYIVPEMPSQSSSGDIFLLYGNIMRAFCIRMVGMIEYDMLHELYAAKRQIGFRAYASTDSHRIQDHAVVGLSVT